MKTLVQQRRILAKLDGLQAEVHTLNGQ